MCHGEESRPPAPPGPPGAIAEAGPFRLRSADGTRFLAYQAIPEQATGIGVVLLPDVRGLHEFYRDLARRFAGAGIAAVVIDYYGRTAVDDERDAGFDGLAHVIQLTQEHTVADIRAAVDHLVFELYCPAPFTVGFCVGGALSWAQSALDDRLAGAIGFYGRPVECRKQIPAMRAPVLVLAAGADQLTSELESREFDQHLTAAGVPHRYVLYEGAPHSFFDGALPEHAAAAADAWLQVLDFLHTHAGDRS